MFMRIHIDLLIPTQRGIRNIRQIESMVAFVRNGGVFDRASLDQYAEKTGVRAGPLIQIEQFEDELTYPRDGLHRLISLVLGGRNYLLDSECEFARRKYSEYEEINLEAGWVTPFDPRTEIRKENLSEWKAKIAQLRDSASNDEVIEFIRANKQLYAETRGDIRRVRDIKLPEPYT
jgi:hypothetical protein